jgi:hypothetical protein
MTMGTPNLTISNKMAATNPGHNRNGFWTADLSSDFRSMFSLFSNIKYS